MVLDILTTLLIALYPTPVMVTSHSTVSYYLSLYMQLSGKLLGSVYTIIYGVSLHWH